MRTETREELIQRVVDDNPLVQEAIRVEPEIGQIIQEVIAMRNQPGYNRVRTYSGLKRRLDLLVGEHAGLQEKPSGIKGEGFRPIGEFADEFLDYLEQVRTGPSHPLRTRKHWDAVIGAITQLLPSDDEDLRAG